MLKSYVSSKYALGVINGTGDGMFSPKAFATRAQAARIIGVLIK